MNIGALKKKDTSVTASDETDRLVENQVADTQKAAQTLMKNSRRSGAAQVREKMARQSMTAQSQGYAQMTSANYGVTQMPMQSSSQMPMQSLYQMPMQRLYQMPMQRLYQMPMQSSSQMPIQSLYQMPMQSSQSEGGLYRTVRY